MPADGLLAYDALKFNTTTGGAAGSGETTSTLGQDRKDVASTGDAAHLSNVQISQLKNLLLQITAFMKGGTRMQMLPQSANPFGAGESGAYIDTAGVFYSVFNGTRTVIPLAQLVTATFTETDSAAVTWSNLGGTQYVFMGLPITTGAGEGPVAPDMINKTSTGGTLRVSGPWTGTISLSIVSI